MALLAAILGWMFDGMEMGLFPLVASPALIDLLELPVVGKPTPLFPRIEIPEGV
jgi:hypothetical protein